jgi:FkbM family methyltransferase
VDITAAAVSQEPAEAASAPAHMVEVTIAGPSRLASLTLPEGDHITLAIERAGAYYEQEMLAAIATCARGGTFVDVGAHYGNHSVFFGLECAAERIVAIEPNPSTFTGLVQNLRNNGLEGIAEPIQAAIHPSWRQVDVYLPSWGPSPGNPAVTNTGMSRVEEARGEAATVALPLDEALSDCTAVTAIKIDVEGGALGVVESGRQTIERDRPLLVIEALSDDEQQRLLDLLLPLGYRAFGPYNWTPTWIWAAT